MAEVYHNNIIDIDLESGTLFRSFLNHTIGSGDNNANWYGVRVFRKGEPIALSGCSVQGLFMPASGSAILISDGTHTWVSGNEAAVLLPQACYNVKGRFTLTIKIIGTNSYSITDTVRIIDGVVADTYSENPVAPTAAVPTYQEVLAVYDQMVAAKEGSVRFDVDQTLTAAQMTQARDNIEAASESDVSDLKSAITEYNAYNFLVPYPTEQSVYNGITWSWDGETCYYSGTSTGPTFYRLYWIDRTHMPEWMKPGETYLVKYNSTDNKASFDFIFYKNGEILSDSDYYLQDGVLTVPTDAEGVQIRLYLENGLTVNGSICVKILNANSNKELSDYGIFRKDSKMLSFGNSLMTGTVFVNGVRDHRSSYDNSPYGNVAKALGIGQKNVNHNIISDTGLISNNELTPGVGTSFLAEIKKADLTAYDYLVTQLHYTDLQYTEYSLGNIYSISGDGTLAGAIIELTEYVKESNGNCQLILVGVFPTTYPGENVFDHQYPLGTIRMLDTLCNQLAKKLHFTYLDWEKCAISYHFQDFTDDFNIHANNEITYRAMGNYLANSIITQNEVPDYDQKTVFYNDLTKNGYTALRATKYPYFYNSTEASQSYSTTTIPVKKGTVCRVATRADGNVIPYAKLTANYVIDYKAEAGTIFDGTIVFDYDGYLVINCIYAYRNYFRCTIYYPDVSERFKDLYYLDVLTKTDQMIENYDPDNICKVLKKGQSLVGSLHSWGVIGASYDSGELNYTLPGATYAQRSELDWYEYSWFSNLMRINGITNFYHYSNGGQNAKDWIRLTGNPEIDLSGRGYCYPAGTETITTRWINGQHSGIGPGGGCWWKLKADCENGNGKQAYVIVLGSNDINNNNPHDSAWNELAEGSYDTTRYYKAGTIADIGTYDLATDTDTVPAGKTQGVVPGVVNSYAAYLGAVLNRIIAIQPNSIIFLSTIRNHFGWNQNSYDLWNQYNDIIKAIANMDQYKNHVILIDYGKFGPNYCYKTMVDQIIGSHPNAIGYLEASYYYGTLLDYSIQKYIERFKVSAFINTDKVYDPID